MEKPIKLWNRNREKKEKEPETIGGMLRRKHRRKYLLLAGCNLVIIGLLLWQLVTTRMRMEQLDNQLTYLMDTNSTIQGEVSSLQSNIQSTLDEEASIISDYSIETTNVDFAFGTYDVTVHVRPKEYTDNTQAVVYFGTNEYWLQMADNEFTGSMTLNLSDSYDGNVSFLFINGEKKSTEVLKDYEDYSHVFDKVLYGNLGKFPSYKDGKLKLEGDTQFYLNGNDTFSFKNCNLVVTAGTEEIYRGNMLTGEVVSKKNTDTDNGSDSGPDAGTNPDLDTGNSDNSNPVSDFSNAINQMIEPDTETSAMIGEEVPVTEQEGTFSVSDVLEVAQDTKVTIRLEAESEDGFVFNYVIFEGRTALPDEEKPDVHVDGWQKAEDYLPYVYTVQDTKGGTRTFE